MRSVLFDGVLTAIVHALTMFRPPHGSSDQRFYYSSAAEEIIKEIESADPSLPITTKSKRQHAMAFLKDELASLSSHQHSSNDLLAKPRRTILISPPRGRADEHGPLFFHYFTSLAPSIASCDYHRFSDRILADRLNADRLTRVLLVEAGDLHQRPRFRCQSLGARLRLACVSDMPRGKKIRAGRTSGPLPRGAGG